MMLMMLGAGFGKERGTADAHCCSWCWRLASGLPEEGADDAHDARGWLRDCRNVGLLMLIDAHGAGGWLPRLQERGAADAH